MAAPKRRRRRVSIAANIPDGILGESGLDERAVDAGIVFATTLARALAPAIERWLAPKEPRLVDPAPGQVPKAPTYFDGYEHALKEARFVIEHECPACECPLCVKLRVKQ